MKSTEDTTPIQRYTVQEQLQQQIVQLNAELARLQSRLAECEKERDELRLDLGRVYGDIGLFAKAQFGLSDNLPTKETFNKMAVGIASIREGLTETIAAIKTLLPITESETWDWTQKRIDESIAEAEQLRDIGVAALALSPTTLRGMAVVPAEELEELRRENKRLQWENDMNAFDISPGMYQAKIDDLNRKLSESEKERGELRIDLARAYDQAELSRKDVVLLIKGQEKQHADLRAAVMELRRVDNVKDGHPLVSHGLLSNLEKYLYDSARLGKYLYDTARSAGEAP